MVQVKKLIVSLSSDYVIWILRAIHNQEKKGGDGRDTGFLKMFTDRVNKYTLNASFVYKVLQ